MITFESSSYDFSRNDSFYDPLPAAMGNSYGYGGNSRRYENTVARDGCSARAERSLSWGARLPQENVNICFHDKKKGRAERHARIFKKLLVIFGSYPSDAIEEEIDRCIDILHRAE